MRIVQQSQSTVDTSTLVPKTTTLTINGTTQDLSANRSWTLAAGDFTWVVKTADESVTSSTTLQDDDTFTFAVEANKTYAIQSQIMYTCAAGGIKLAFKVPSILSPVTTIYGSLVSSYDAVVKYIGANTAGNVVASSGASVGSTSSAILDVEIVIPVGSTAGNIVINWAQLFSNASATTILAGSYLAYKKLN